MKTNHEIKLKKIIDGLRCPKDFECYKLRFDDLCKAEDIGLDSFVMCLEKDSLKCVFSLPFGDIYICKCPLRIYICKELKK